MLLRAPSEPDLTAYSTRKVPVLVPGSVSPGTDSPAEPGRRVGCSFSRTEAGCHSEKNRCEN